MDETSALDPFQSGFRPGFGTETALVEKLHIHLDKGVLALLIHLDLSVAFSTVDHFVLIDCLASLGVRNTALSSCHSFRHVLIGLLLRRRGLPK